jgi:hypothetical protein
VLPNQTTAVVRLFGDRNCQFEFVPLCHRGMRITDSDWNAFLGHAAATLAKFQVPEAEQREVVAFVQSLKKEIVE